MEITNLSLEQNNALVQLAKAGIPYIVTGRFSFESSTEPSDLDLLIPLKYLNEVDKYIKWDNAKKEENYPAEEKKTRKFYNDKIDILYICDQTEWDAYDTFSRIENGIKVAHPAHSMIAKIKMVASKIPFKYQSCHKHAKDLEEYLTATLTTEYNTNSWNLSGGK